MIPKRKCFLQQSCLWNLLLQVIVTKANGAAGLQLQQHDYPLHLCKERHKHFWTSWLMASAYDLTVKRGFFFPNFHNWLHVFCRASPSQDIFTALPSALFWLGRFGIRDVIWTRLCFVPWYIVYSVSLYVPVKLIIIWSRSTFHSEISQTDYDKITWWSCWPK